MYNVRSDLVAGVQNAQDLQQLKHAVLSVLGEIGTDHDRFVEEHRRQRSTEQARVARLDEVEQQLRLLEFATRQRNP